MGHPVHLSANPVLDYEGTMKASPGVLIRRIVLLAILVFGGTIYIFVWQPTWLLHWNDFRTGNKIISRIETYRKTHLRLPDSLDDLGISDPDIRIYYKKTSDTEYIVWFGTTLGESETYDSQTKKWD